jgi:hypothetical protein
LFNNHPSSIRTPPDSLAGAFCFGDEPPVAARRTWQTQTQRGGARGTAHHSLSYRNNCNCSGISTRIHRQPVGEDGGKRGDAWGCDAGKKFTGRTRFIGVDAQGFLLEVLVLEASLSESRGAEKILPHLKALYPDLNVV